MNHSSIVSLALALIPVLIFTVCGIIPLSIIIYLHRIKYKNRKTPLTRNMLRSPGESVKEKIENLSSEILEYIFYTCVMPVTTYSLFVSLYYFSSKKIDILSMYLFTVIVISIICISTFKLYQKLNQRKKLRLGYECELAVGQELNNLMKDGFNVYHDFPADKFNIDHIAIGPTGIFTIETKGRSKEKIARNENWKLNFDGKSLHFPGWIETDPIDQVRRQTKWFREWIKNATGTDYKINSILAIPGWYINQKAICDIKVVNGIKFSFIAKGETILFPEQIRAISYQIEQKCRDVQPVSSPQNPQ